MAVSFNKVILLGNLTRDPELRHTPNNTPVCKFGIAVNDPRASRSQDGGGDDRVLFVDITTWSRTAELCHQYLSKGRQVLVEGRLDLDRWEDKDSGQKRSKHYVTAFTVQFIGGRDDGQGGGGGFDDRDSYSGGGGGGNRGGGSYDRGSRSQDAPRDREPSYNYDDDRAPSSGGGHPPQSRDDERALKDFGLDDDDVPF